MLGSLELVIGRGVGVDAGVQEHQRARVCRELFLVFLLENENLFETYVLEIVQLG